MKRPASQYYWGDWRRDTGLQSCSLAARGLWHEMNCLMHDCEPYGHLRVGVAPMQVAQLARLVGETPKAVSALLAELEAAGVFSRSDDGGIYSRRMVRDEALRERRAQGGHLGAEDGWMGSEHGKKGGRPRKKNPPQEKLEGGFEPPLAQNEKPPPASASASASASAIPITPTEVLTRSHGEQPAGERAPEDPPGPPSEPTPSRAGSVCMAMRRAGIPDCNPGHPELLALIEAGATDAEFAGAAKSALDRGRGFPYALGVLKGQRSDAARTAGVIHHGPIRAMSKQQAIEAEGKRAGAEWLAQQRLKRAAS